jgi:transposase
LSLVFLDESGFMLQPLVRRTWALRGQTPVLKSWDRRERLSVISAVTVSPTRKRFGLYFMVQRENVKTDAVKHFLRQLRKHLPRGMVAVMDRLNAHRSAARAMEKTRWCKVEWLPAYAPELNPVEYIWSNIKYGKLANFVATDVDHLEERVSASLSITSHDVIKGAFKHAGLSL